MKAVQSVLNKAIAFGILLAQLLRGTPLTHRETTTPITLRQPPPTCSGGTTIEDLWVVDQLNVTYTHDETVRPGNAAWRLANTMTSDVEVLRCNLRANYICELNGTPGDSGLHVWLQINLDVARITINQSLPCGDAGDPKSVAGLVLSPLIWANVLRHHADSSLAEPPMRPAPQSCI
jgi:hypothetical protein